MMHLENKQINYKLKGEEASYGALILHCLDVTPKNGFDRKEMKLRDKLEEIVSEGKGEFVFESSDGVELKRIVAFPGWVNRDKEVLQFLDDVADMEETK